MSLLEDKENVVHKVEEAESQADCGTKRKSPSEALGSDAENLETETSPIKRIRLEEPLVSVTDEPNTNTPVKIKLEPGDDVDEPATSSDTIQVKTEPTTNKNSPAAVVVKTEPTNSSAQTAVDSSVSSSSTRISCRFGIRCYRRNPAHRSAEAHPGDQDYRRPNFPDPPLGTPACPFGNACYRRNPVHFQEHSHPADFNSEQNIRSRLRQRQNQRQNDNDSGTDEEDDPFADENYGDTDYRPGADIDEDDDDELEFDSQRINSDDYD